MPLHHTRNYLPPSGEATSRIALWGRCMCWPGELGLLPDSPSWMLPGRIRLRESGDQDWHSSTA